MSTYFGQLLDSNNNQLIAESSESGEGYIKLPNGILIQWGIVTNTSNAYVQISFPVSFIDVSYYLYATRFVNNENDPNMYVHNITQRQTATTGIVYFYTSTAPYSGTNASATWVAIGKWK